MELIPNGYFYAMIPYIIIGVGLLIIGVKAKDIDAWQYAGIIILVGITPFNSILLLIALIFIGSAIVVASLETLGRWVFEKLTNT